MRARAPKVLKSKRWRWTGAALAVVIALTVGGYTLFHRARPYLQGSSCEVQTTLGKMPLDLEQGANAATIAAVAFRKQLPERAAVIAYATAIQESRIRNLPDGDRDSVGMFQQRPSQGWGSPEKLRDPVQSTSKFYDALVKVKDYLDRDLHDAAQIVQRSADGDAYAQHEPDGKLLARAFTGREASSVRCWFTPKKKTAPRRTEALREMRRAFGGRLQLDAPQAALPKSKNQAMAQPSAGARAYDAVKVTNARTGWAVATWTVTHAQAYGLTEIRHGGKRWHAGSGHDGWTPDPKAPANRVIIR
ncbi:heavy metal transporter [Actinomadura vinacea]|uniref:Heavy metal transporter n=1 Tax=Actinomadura vinacea TaxID=115336 RepID=A0ABN3J2F6_9ACTN